MHMPNNNSNNPRSGTPPSSNSRTHRCLEDKSLTRSINQNYYYPKQQIKNETSFQTKYVQEKQMSNCVEEFNNQLFLNNLTIDYICKHTNLVIQSSQYTCYKLCITKLPDQKVLKVFINELNHKDQKYANTVLINYPDLLISYLNHRIYELKNRLHGFSSQHDIIQKPENQINIEESQYILIDQDEQNVHNKQNLTNQHLAVLSLMLNTTFKTQQQVEQFLHQQLYLQQNDISNIINDFYYNKYALNINTNKQQQTQYLLFNDQCDYNSCVDVISKSNLISQQLILKIQYQFLKNSNKQGQILANDILSIFTQNNKLVIKYILQNKQMPNCLTDLCIFVLEQQRIQQITQQFNFHIQIPQVDNVTLQTPEFKYVKIVPTQQLLMDQQKMKNKKFNHIILSNNVTHKYPSLIEQIQCISHQ